VDAWIGWIKSAVARGANETTGFLYVVVPLRRHSHVSILLIVSQHGANLVLELAGERIQVSGPCVAAIGALQRDDRPALHDERASVVMALRTHDRKRVIRVRHGRREPILLQSFAGGNRSDDVM
jgi:hypothetical protein